MNDIVKPITPDGRTGFDKFGQLFSWSVPDLEGNMNGRIIADVRDKLCYICNRGWGNTSGELRDQVYENGIFMHGSCAEGFAKLRERYLLSDALIDGGFLFDFEEVPPRYPHSTPWRRVDILTNEYPRKSSGFKIVMGRRKRVWEIRAHGVGDMSKEFEDMGNDTRGFIESSEDEPEFGSYYMVHAYSKEKMIDYLRRFQKKYCELAEKTMPGVTIDRARS
jgi:hypothetical protein